MGRNNKTLQGAFTSIIGNSSERSAIEQFITRHAASDLPGEYSLAKSLPGTEADLPGEYPLAKYLNQYKLLAAENSVAIDAMAQLETIIMQLKARIDMQDITIYFNRQKYIYARCPFYRSDREVKEIRVCVEPIAYYFSDGPTQENLGKLMVHDEFMKKVYDKVAEAMDQEIKNSVKIYDILKNNLEYSN
jgi:hypothetical protein